MSVATVTLIATPDPEPADPADLARLRDRLALAEQAYGDLLAATQATLAAEDGPYRYRPTLWIREHLTALGQMPAPGAKPSDIVPVDARDATWGRW
jgi:hypothetical protein